MDVVRYPTDSDSGRLVQLLEHHRIDLVIDIGANAGQFASELRRCGYRGRIHSFEPLPQAYAALRERSSSDPLWAVAPFALGPVDEPATLHVAGNAGASSSMLPMLRRHEEAAPESAYVGTVTVEQHRLDTLWDGLGVSGRRVFLKIDVQGYEERVLAGAPTALTSIVGLQLEVSLVPLYEGGFDLSGALALAARHDLVVEQVARGFTDPASGQLLQVDLLLFRGDGV